MPIQIEKETNDIVQIRATGTLTKEDFSHFKPQFEQILHERGKLRVLFDMTGFEGWEPKGFWEETKFDIKHNSDIRRMAVVGDEKWHHALITVFKPFVAAEVRYFPRGESSEARRWLLEPQSA
jgi:hypothetical protein